jgi:hypothetical protein
MQLFTERNEPRDRAFISLIDSKEFPIVGNTRDHVWWQCVSHIIDLREAIEKRLGRKAESLQELQQAYQSNTGP